MKDFKGLALAYERVPEAENFDGDIKTINGKLVAIDEGNYIRVWLDQEKVSEDYDDPERGKGTEEYYIGFSLECKKPATRGDFVNAAEMKVYGLRDAMAVASFGTALARKARLNPEDEEVTTHDEFIQWVKEELTNVGY